MKKLSIMSLIFVIITSLLLGGCGAKEDNVSKENSETNKNLVIKLAGGDWGLPNPYMNYPRGPGSFKTALIFDSLLERDEKGTIPWLSSKYEIKNKKEYIFTLQDNVKWHDGEKFSAEDVKFTFDYYKDHSPVSNSLMVNGKYIIDSVEVIDNNKVKINTDSENATYLEKIGGMRILPKHIWETVADPNNFTDAKATIGCGPFKFVSYNREQGTYKLDAFKDYWGPKPRVKSIEWVPVSDPVLAFEKGEIDLFNVPADILSKYENDKNVKILKSKAFWGYRLTFNMKKREELKDINVRKALAYGIDRKDILEKVGRNAGIVASMGYLPKEHVWYNDNVEKYDLDIEKAKQLMNGKTLSFELLIGNDPKEVKIAELMKLSLQQAGIALNIKSVDGKTRDSLVKSNDYELAIIGHGGWGSDADMLRQSYAASKGKGSEGGKDANGGKDVKGGKGGNGGNGISGNGIPGYSNEEINALAQKQMNEMDENKRKELVFKLQEVIAKEVPQIPLYNTISYDAYKPSKYDGWMNMFNHHSPEHSKLSYLERK